MPLESRYNSPLYRNAPNLETLTKAFALCQLESKRVATYKDLDRFDELLLAEYTKKNSLPPAPQFITFFAYLPAVPLTQIPVDERSCIICHDPFYHGRAGGEAPQKLPCGHLVGEGCIRKWLFPHGRATTCPMCRTPLLESCDPNSDVFRLGHMDISAKSVDVWIWLDHLGFRVRCEHDRARLRVRRYRDVVTAHANAVTEYNDAMGAMVDANPGAAAHETMQEALPREVVDQAKVLEVRKGVLDRVWYAMHEVAGRFEADMASARRYCEPERDARAQRRYEEGLQMQMFLGHLDQGSRLERDRRTLLSFEANLADIERRVERTMDGLRDAQHGLQQLSREATGILESVRAAEARVGVGHGAGPGASAGELDEGVGGGLASTSGPQGPDVSQMFGPPT